MSAECTGCGREITDKERPDCRLLKAGALCPDCVDELESDRDSDKNGVDDSRPIGSLIAWSFGCLITAAVARLVVPSFLRMFEETGVEVSGLSRLVIDLLDNLGGVLGLITLLFGWGLGMVAIERLHKAGYRTALPILVGFAGWLLVMLLGIAHPIVILIEKL